MEASIPVSGPPEMDLDDLRIYIESIDDQLNTSVGQVFETLERTLKEVAEWKDLVKKLTNSIRELHSHAAVNKSAINKCQKELTQAKETMKAEIGNSLSLTRGLESRIDKRINNIEKNNISIEESKKNHDKLGSQIGTVKNELNHFKKQTAEEFAVVKASVAEIKGDIESSKQDLGEFKSEVSELKTRYDQLKQDTDEKHNTLMTRMDEFFTELQKKNQEDAFLKEGMKKILGLYGIEFPIL